ncbi:MAG: hypothetical protein ACI9XK_001015 [Granulosicoccus sp.]|jgi:hypothetical protein
MSVSVEFQTGIWLNTPVTFFDIQSEHALRLAQNDSDWRFATNDYNQVTEQAALAESSLYQNSCRTLYTHVKFKVTTEIVSNYYLKCQGVTPFYKLTTLDIGCSLQMLRRHLSENIRDLRYVGVDSLAKIYPDIICDVSSSAVSQAFKSVKPDVVVALDLLPTLHDTADQLTATFSRWLKALDEKPGLYVFTIPECYKSDEHLLKLESEQWLELLNETFIIEDIQAIGFLSALPYWIGGKLPVSSKNVFQRTLNRFKEPLYEPHALKTIESMLTLVFRRIKILRRFSHSIVVTARSRTVS